jgi:hypothetical protein
MWKANGKTNTLVLFLESLFPNLEKAMDLSQDRLLLDLTLDEPWWLGRYSDGLRARRPEALFPGEAIDLYLPYKVQTASVRACTCMCVCAYMRLLCETLPLGLRAEHRQGIFEKRVLTTIFGPKKKKVTGEQTEIAHNEELHDFHSSTNIFTAIKLSRMRKERTCSTNRTNQK